MDNEILIRPNQISLKLIGAWPGYTQLAGFFLVIGWPSVLLFFAIWNVTEIYDNVDLLMDNLINSIAVIIGILKLITLRLQRRSLLSILNKMFEDYQTKKTIDEFQCTRNNVELAKRICKTIFIFYNAIISTFILKLIVTCINDSAEDRKYIAPVSFPKFIKAKQSPIYEIIIFGQLGTTFFCANTHALIEGLLASSVLHASSKIDVVRQEIVRFSNICRLHTENRKLIMTALRRLVRVHLKCDQFSENVEHVFTIISFIHLFCMILAQVSSGYMFIFNLEEDGDSVQKIHYATITIVFLLSCSYYCIAGEYLANQNDFLAMELYNCCWCDFQVPEKKAIMFIMAKSRRPVRLTFGKFEDLNLFYLTKIIKTSFSYLSLARQVR